MTKLVMVACMDSNRGIGFEGKLPWAVPLEMKEFLKSVEGSLCVMGSKTFDTIPESFKDNHEIVVWSRDPNKYPDHAVFSNLDFLKENYSDMNTVSIIGGSELYESALSIVDEMLLTVVHNANKQYVCDAFFPEFDESQWDKVLVYTADSYDIRGTATPVVLESYLYSRKDV